MKFLLAGTRSLSVLALGVVLVLVMAVAPGAGAKTGTSPNLQNAVLLFQGRGAGLVHSLQKNFYGPGDHTDVLQVTDEGILFDPTDDRDHLATPYLELPFAFWQKRHVLIELAASAKDAEADNLLITVQRDGFTTVISLSPDMAKAVSGTWSAEFLVPRVARQIRFVFTSADQNVTRVPSKITVWSEDPPLPQAALSMVGAGVVSLCALMLIWVVRRRAAMAPARNP